MRNRLVAIVLAAALVSAFAGPRLFAQDAPGGAGGPAASAPTDAEKAKAEKIRKLLRLTGAEATAKQTFNMMLDQFAKMPTLPRGFVEKFRSKASAADMVEINVPIYAHHLDDATIDAAIAFYESAAGKAFVQQQPAIVQESMTAGGEYGRRMATEVMQELQKEHEGK